MSTSQTAITIVEGEQRTTLTLGVKGPAGPSWPEQLYAADLIDSPTLDAALTLAQQPAADATDAANAAAALASENAVAAQAVVDAGADIREARDSAVGAAGTATAAATSLAGSVSEIARIAQQIGGNLGGRGAGRWIPGIVDDVTKSSLLSFSATTGRAKMMGVHDLDVSDATPTGRGARAFCWSLRLPNSQTIMGVDANNYQVSYLGLTAAEAHRLILLGGASTYTAPDAIEAQRIVALGGGTTLTSFLSPNTLQANTITDLGVGSGGATSGRSAGGFKWSLKFADGRSLVGVDATLQIGYLALATSEASRLVELGGGLTAAALLTPNTLRTYHATDIGVISRGTGRQAGGYVWTLKFDNGQTLIGVDPATSQIGYLGLNAAEAARIIALGGGAAGAAYTAPVQLRDGRLLLDSVTRNGFLIGKVTDTGGFFSQVKQRVAGTSAVAVGDDPRPMQIFLTFGQSNAGSGGVTGVNPRKLIGAVYPYHVFGMAKGSTPYFQTSLGATDDGTENDLLPLQDYASSTGVPQLQGIMNAIGAEAAYRARGETGPGTIGHVDWWGGQGLAMFVKGTQTYANIVQHVGLMGSLAQGLYGRAIAFPAISLIQGESGPTNGTWQSMAAQLVSDLRTDTLTAGSGYGMTTAPVVIVSQINAKDNDTAPTSVPLEQIALCRALPTTTAMAGPMYYARLKESDIHPDAEGRVMHGEMVGEIHTRIAKGITWEPLWSTGVTRAGNIITIQYTRPGDDLEFDSGNPSVNDGWVKPVADPFYGYYYADSTAGTGSPITIQSVAILAGTDGRLTKVIVTLTGNPDSATGRVLSYAYHVFDSSEDGWSTTRGSLRSRMRKSELRGAGLSIPQFLYAYACQEQWKTGDSGVTL